MKFQQLTGPVMAKGVEDTAFYIYNRLVSLNEVGGEPDRFGVSRRRVPPPNAERAAALALRAARPRRPTTPSAARTCARGSTCSPRCRATGGRRVDRWRRLNRRTATAVEGAPPRRATTSTCSTRRCSAPGRSELDQPDDDFVDRIRGLHGEGDREAKVHTSWINPNGRTTRRRAASSAAILDPTATPRSSTTSRRLRAASAGRDLQLAGADSS